MNLKGIKDTEQDKTRRRNNIILTGFVALASIVGFYLDGYLWRSTLLFELSFLAAITISIVAAVRMKTKHLASLLLSTAVVSAVVEHTMHQQGCLPIPEVRTYRSSLYLGGC